MRRNKSKVKLSVEETNQILNRIFEVTNTRTQEELARLLEIKQSSVSDTKRRCSISSDWYLMLFDKFRINPDWLRFGLGPRFIRTETNCNTLEDENKMSIKSVNMKSSFMKPVYGPVYCLHIRKDSSEPEIKFNIVLPEAYLKENISVYYVNNTSLAPFISKNSLVGIDTTYKHPASGEIFAALIQFEGIILGHLYYDDSQSSYIIKTNHAVYRLLAQNIENQIVGKLSWILNTV